MTTQLTSHSAWTAQPVVVDHSAHFLIHVTRELGAMQRLLGTVRRRGFQIESMMATRDAAGNGYRIEIRLNGDCQGVRSFEILGRQIARNLDVTSVSMMSSDASRV